MNEIKLTENFEYMTPYITTQQTNYIRTIIGTIGDFMFANKIFPLVKPKYYDYGLDVEI